MTVSDIKKARRKAFIDKQVSRWEESTPGTMRGISLQDAIETVSENVPKSSMQMRNIQSYVQDDKKFLILSGAPGLGKTTLAYCVAKELIETLRCVSFYNTTYAQLMTNISFAHDKEYGDTEWMKKSTADLYFIDDVGAGNFTMTPTQNRGLWELINRRWEFGKKTILTTNLPLKTEKKDVLSVEEVLGPAIWDRVSSNGYLTQLSKGKSLRQEDRDAYNVLGGSRKDRVY